MVKETPEERFIRELRRAKADNVDVDRTFIHTFEARLLALVRVFSVALSVVWCFIGPPATVWMIIVCHREGIDTRDIPLPLVYWTCQALGFVSVLAFGFDLVKVRVKPPPLVQAITRIGETTLQLEPLDDGTNGDV